MEKTHDLIVFAKDQVPEQALPLLHELFSDRKVIYQLSRNRKSKLGHFRAEPRKTPVISVNKGLNPYSFLITLVHEIAHHTVWMEYKRTVAPHGHQWKTAFQKHMIPFLTQQCFPDDLIKVLARYLKNPTASSLSHLPLARALSIYDQSASLYLIEDLFEGARFQYGKKRIFIRGSVSRTRIVCMDEATGRKYSFHPLTEVEPLP